MANKLRHHPKFVDDLIQAMAWYDSKSAALGDRLRAALEQTFKVIEKSPEAFSLAFEDSDIRYRQVRRFPYLILYRYSQGVIHVGGIFHTASDPQKWRNRMSDL